MALLQDVVNTWLCDAVGSGARILTGLHVDKVLMEDMKPVSQRLSTGSNAGHRSAGSHSRAKRAVGVSATILGSGQQPQPQLNGCSKDMQIRVSSRVVVSSCGALHTPALLLRSGMRGVIGSNLRLHPAVFVAAEFPEAS